MAKDSKTISKEPHELRTVIDYMAKQGIEIKGSDVLKAIEQVGNDRELVYQYLQDSNNNRP